MQTTSGARRFWSKSPVMEPHEPSWPAVRFGVIGEAWSLYRRHWGVWSITMLVSVVCVAVGQGLVAASARVSTAGLLGGLIGFGVPPLPLIPLILSFVIAGFFLCGMVRMAVNQARGRAPRVEDLFHVGDSWFDVILGSALVGLVVTLGWSLLVVPGLIAGGLLMLTYPLIVDGNLPATGAMIQSYHALKSQWLLATMVHLAMVAVAGLGSICGGIGLLVTGPLYALSLAVLYRDLFLSPYSPTWKKPAAHFDEI